MSAFHITKCLDFFLQSELGQLLQSVSIFITNCVRYYKVCQVLQSVVLLQSELYTGKLIRVMEVRVFYTPV